MLGCQDKIGDSQFSQSTWSHPWASSIGISICMSNCFKDLEGKRSYQAGGIQIKLRWASKVFYINLSAPSYRHGASMVYTCWDWCAHAEHDWRGAQEQGSVFSKQDLAWLCRMFETIKYSFSLEICCIKWMAQEVFEECLNIYQEGAQRTYQPWSHVDGEMFAWNLQNADWCTTWMHYQHWQVGFTALHNIFKIILHSKFGWSWCQA